MKKTLSLLCLVLACLMLLCACQTDDPGSDVTVYPQTGEKTGSCVGSWYAEAGLAAIELREDGTLTYYSIQPGYYAYYEEQSGSYTLEGNALTILLGDESTSLTYDATAGTLATSDAALSFTRVDVLPDPHPKYLFPDYSKMDCSAAVTVGTYRGLTATANAEANARLAIFEEYYAANKDQKPVAITADRAAAYGDVVVIDYSGKLDGVAFEGGTATAQQINLVQNSGYIDGFAEGVLGHKMGETFDVNVTFPENYGSKDLAGKAVVFTMTLHTIYDLSLSNEAAKKLNGNFNTYADLLADYTKREKTSDLWNQITAKSTYDKMPLEFYQYFYQYYVDYYHSYAFSYGMDYSMLTQYMGITDANLKENAMTTALPYVIAQHIFKTENLSWKEGEYDRMLDLYIADAMEYFKYTKEEAREFVLREEESNIKATLTYQAVSEFLLTVNS